MAESQEVLKTHRAAYVVRDEKVAMLLVDPMRRTILNLLADESLTQSQMANKVGMTDASIGHHLRILADAKLIKIVRREEEMHGIMQNFYRSIARCIVVDTSHMPSSVSKYFFPINIERVRGAISAQSLERAKGKSRSPSRSGTSTKELEEMGDKLASSIAKVALKMGSEKTILDRESITIEIYRRALQELFDGSLKVPQI